jgi:hypothetical protein
MKNIHRKLYGPYWQFPGGAESSYSRIVKKIQAEKSLSKKKQDELIEEITYLVGHVLSDVDFQLRNRYGSAQRSGIKYLSFRLFDRPAKWVEKLFYNDLKSVYATALLESLQSVNNIRVRVEKTAERLLTKETEK